MVLGGLPWGSTSLEEKWSGTVPGLPDPPSTLDQILDYMTDKAEAFVVSIGAAAISATPCECDGGA